MDLKPKLYQQSIAITGGIGCGKSTVGRILRSMNFLVIDADHLSRQAVSQGGKGLEQLTHHFGKSILSPTGELNRQKAAEIIFKDSESKKIFEGIVHPLVHKSLAQILEAEKQRTKPYWFYEIPLLFENNLQSSFRRVWVVDCPEPIQIARIQKRDGRSESAIRQIIANQFPQREKRRLADWVVNTDCTYLELKNRVFEQLDFLNQQT